MVRKFLKRPHLPVLKLENDIEYADERGKYGPRKCLSVFVSNLNSFYKRLGILQFHTKLGRVLGQKSPHYCCVLSLMTLDAVRAAAKELEVTVRSYTK